MTPSAKATSTTNKLSLDALTGVVYEDDSQIHALHVEKAYDKRDPRIEIECMNTPGGNALERMARRLASYKKSRRLTLTPAGSTMLDPRARYFPQHDAPEMESFRMAFFHMIFEHAEYERRVSQLMGIIAGDEQLVEKRLPDAKDRPKEMRKLIGKHHPNGLAQTDDIVNCLHCSITLCHDRNLLTHGHWWKLDQTGITVRSDRDRPDQERCKKFTPAEIELIANTFGDLETELYKLQHAIEEQQPRRPKD